MSTVLVLPIVVPLASAVLGLLAWRSERAQRFIGVAGTAGLLVASLALAAAVRSEGPIAAQMGDWAAPFGITLVADMLSALMVAVTGLMGLAVAIYATVEVDPGRRAFGFYPLLHVLLTGVCGAFLTGDLFNLYVFFEVMLIASFVLLALGGERPQMEGALKYVTLNLVSSAIFLSGVGLLYGMTGTLNMAHLSERVAELAATRPDLVAAVAGLLLVSFGIKAGVFPLYFWLPSSYHTPAVSASAIFAGLLTKVGVYALLRVFTLVFADTVSAHRLLLWIAGLTMLAGVLGAVSQFNVRRILSFHIISQIGYMVMGLALLASPSAAARRMGLIAAVFYIVHHIVVKTNLFLIAGVIRRVRGTEELEETGGLFVAAPWLAALFLVPALSLAGIPPLSGFWAKLAMIRAGLEAELWVLVGAAVAAGLLTLLSMIKIWNEAFWKALPEGAPRSGEPHRAGTVVMVAPVVVLAVVTILIGLFPQALLDLAGQAGDQLLDPSGYRAAVGLATGAGEMP
ncbi:MAG: Na+/H+ antiporter subunit D [Acidobacteriota bacterium]|nr:Na+/H+ antiporter subunit D [Acidobacteriota bacterium]